MLGKRKRTIDQETGEKARAVKEALTEGVEKRNEREENVSNTSQLALPPLRDEEGQLALGPPSAH